MRKSLFLLLLCVSISFAQDGTELPKLVPPAPNAASIHTYGNTQTNFYTGAPNISIPIYEIEDNGISVPIYLNYSAGNGVKVSEIASWVGLGWSLNVGGNVSRTRRGRNDEDSSFGFFKLDQLLRIESGMSYDERFDLFQMELGKRDSEPDAFFYSFPGGSGKFFFDLNENVQLKPRKNFNIIHHERMANESLSNNLIQLYHNIIDDFEITDENGTKFLFSDKEYNISRVLGSPHEDDRGFPSTWNISKISNPYNTSDVIFDYQEYIYTIKNYSGNKTTGIEIEVHNETTYSAKRLQTITFSNGSVEFVPSEEGRKDLEGDKYLSQIIIKDGNGNIIKKYLFDYKYFTANGLESDGPSLTVSDENRLVLYGIQEVSRDGTMMPPHIFEYDTQYVFPDRNSKAIDHWCKIRA